MREEYGDVAQVQTGCAEVEDGYDCLSGSDADEVEATAEDYDQPDCIYWSAGGVVYFAPEV